MLTARGIVSRRRAPRGNEQTHAETDSEAGEGRKDPALRKGGMSHFFRAGVRGERGDDW